MSNMKMSSKSVKNFYTKKFTAIFLWLSFILFGAGFFLTNRSMELIGLFYAARQVFLPSFFVGFIGFCIGKILDSTSEKTDSSEEIKKFRI